MHNKNIKEKSEESLGRFIIQTILLAVFILAIFYLLFTFVLSNDAVSGISMQPNFEDGDRLISVRHRNIKRGDIVILKAPHTKNALYIKRVVGMPGDTVKFKDDTLYINNRKKNEPYLTQGKKLYANGELYTNNFTSGKLAVTQGISRVPKNSYFVMGDHRNVSRDSRLIGYINKNRIIGVVKLRYWPVQKLTFY